MFEPLSRFERWKDDRGNWNLSARGKAILHRSYNFLVFLRLISFLAACVLIVVVVFIAEETVGVLHQISYVESELDRLPGMLILRIPKILDIAMPLAVLIAAYRVLLGLREARELVVLASAKIGGHYMLRVLLLFAVMSAASTAFLSGFVDPAARYLLRESYFEFLVAAVRNGLPTERFWYLGSNTLYNWNAGDSVDKHTVFLFQQEENKTDRVITAEGSNVIGPDEEGRYALLIEEFSMQELRLKTNGNGSEAGRLQNWEAGQLVQRISLDDYLYFDERTHRKEEWSISELAGISEPPGELGVAHFHEALVRINKALLCLIAPALAVFAVCFTVPRTFFVGLPGFCGLMLGADFALQFAYDLLPAPNSFVWSAFAAAVVCVFMLIWGAAFLATRHERFLRPQLDRP